MSKFSGLFHSHQWGKWNVISRKELYEKYVYECKDNPQRLVGMTITQERVCLVCNLTQIRKDKASI